MLFVISRKNVTFLLFFFSACVNSKLECTRDMENCQHETTTTPEPFTTPRIVSQQERNNEKKDLFFRQNFTSLTLCEK